jgi:S1-C subfamily serine protease
VLPDGGAAKAGIVPGDRIVAVDGKPVADRIELLKRMEGRKPGEKVKVTCVRGDEEIEFEIELRAKSMLFGDPMSRNDQMSGRFSPRRSGFPRVLEHDIPGARDSVGGPLLTLDGACVGINIARANRAENFAIPAREAREAIARLRAHAGR